MIFWNMTEIHEELAIDTLQELLIKTFVVDSMNVLGVYSTRRTGKAVLGHGPKSRSCK